MPEIVNERVVSVIGNSYSDIKEASTVVVKEETALSKQTSELEQKAETTPVTNDAEYQAAAEFGKMLKVKASEVKEFFDPMKKAANKAHKEICDREKAMLTPLANAERLIKRSMGDYATEQERKRKEAEEAARKAAEEAANRRLAEAVELEKQGNVEAANTAIEEAEIIDTAASSITVGASAPKVSGVSQRKDWEVIDIDDSSVPINVMGAELRPVDKAAVMRLIRATKGSIQIPGVKYKETTNMSFSRR